MELSLSSHDRTRKENIKIAEIFLMALILTNIFNNVIKPINNKNES